jgi:hypothetical protein
MTAPNSTPITIQEIRKNVNIDEEIATDLLFRQSKVLYPEVEEWVLKLAIEAYQNQLKQEEVGVSSPSDEQREEAKKEQPPKMQEIN